MSTPAPVAEETAPEQENLAGDANTSASYGSLHHRMKAPKFPTPQELDARLPKKVRDLMNQWVVEVTQFDEMEDAGAALTCARVLRLFLIFFIVSSTFGLCVGFFFKASLAAPMETEQHGELAAPSVVFCASPWGSNFLGFDVEGVSQGLVPGGGFHAIDHKNWTITNFNASLGAESAPYLTGCRVVELEGVMLKPLGKVALYSAFETIRISASIQTEDGQFNFGFCNSDNWMPQRWSYGSAGTRLTGEIKYDQVNVGATDVSDGIPRSILGFKGTGKANLGHKTELEYFYGYFMVRILSAQAKGISVFSMVAFVLLVAAAVNNCGLFDLFFVEVIPDDEPPPPLQPNMLCQTVCGKACAACRRRKKTDSEQGSQAGDAESATAEKA